MTFFQIVLRIALRGRKMFPLIVHQSSDYLQMINSSGFQPCISVVWAYPRTVGEWGDVARQKGWAPALQTHTQQGRQRTEGSLQLCVLRSSIVSVWLCGDICAGFQCRKRRLIVILFTIHYDKIAEDCWRQEPLTSHFSFICRSTFINDSPL